MSAELATIDDWIYDMLRDDPAINTPVGGRIYSDQAPQGAASPMVVFAFLGGADKLVMNTRSMSHALYLIRAIAESMSYSVVKPIADRIDTILTVPSSGLTLGDTKILACRREQPHQRKDSENGVPVVYLGGMYRLWFQPL